MCTVSRYFRRYKLDDKWQVLPICCRRRASWCGDVPFCTSSSASLPYLYRSLTRARPDCLTPPPPGPLTHPGSSFSLLPSTTSTSNCGLFRRRPLIEIVNQSLRPLVLQLHPLPTHTAREQALQNPHIRRIFARTPLIQFTIHPHTNVSFTHCCCR